MKRNTSFKKMLCVLMLLMGVNININAQSDEPFEGEITFETYENYSDFLLNNSFVFNGVHKMRLILKGDKMHLIDETTKCHILADNSVPSYVLYCDLTKTGWDYGKDIGAIQFLFNGEIKYGGSSFPISSYTFAPTETKKNILDKECVLYQGDVNRKIVGMEQKSEVKAYVSDIKAPAGYKWSMSCLDTPGIALKYSYKYDGGHFSAGNIGEISMYYESDVTSITPRKVEDSEFVIPSDYKIFKGALVKYFEDVKKELVKLGVKGESKDKKTTGVHYKTNGEWDF